MIIDQQSVSLDPRDPEFVQDPYPFYAELRDHCPVFHWKALGHWCFAGYQDVSVLLRDRRFGRQILLVIALARGEGGAVRGVKPGSPACPQGASFRRRLT